MNIAVVSFNNEPVDKGLIELLDLYQDEEITVLLPVTQDDQVFTESVLRVCIDKSVKVTCFIAHAAGLDHILKQADSTVVADNPVKEVLNNLSVGDAFGFCWKDDDAKAMLFLIEAVEDLALDVWEISEGLTEWTPEDDPYDHHDLHEVMHQSLGMFVDALAAFVSSVVMESLTQAVEEHLAEQENKKGISPFDEDDLD